MERRRLQERIGLEEVLGFGVVGESGEAMASAKRIGSSEYQLLLRYEIWRVGG